MSAALNEFQHASLEAINKLLKDHSIEILECTQKPDPILADGVAVSLTTASPDTRIWIYPDELEFSIEGSSTNFEPYDYDNGEELIDHFIRIYSRFI